MLAVPSLRNEALQRCAHHPSEGCWKGAGACTRLLRAAGEFTPHPVPLRRIPRPPELPAAPSSQAVPSSRTNFCCLSQASKAHGSTQSKQNETVPPCSHAVGKLPDEHRSHPARFCGKEGVPARAGQNRAASKDRNSSAEELQESGHQGACRNHRWTRSPHAAEQKLAGPAARLRACSAWRGSPQALQPAPAGSAGQGWTTPRGSPVPQHGPSRLGRAATKVPRQRKAPGNCQQKITPRQAARWREPEHTPRKWKTICNSSRKCVQPGCGVSRENNDQRPRGAAVSPGLLGHKPSAALLLSSRHSPKPAARAARGQGACERTLLASPVGVRRGRDPASLSVTPREQQPL